jgi:hypothetical protein
VESYIVRIYRRDGDAIAGTMEDPLSHQTIVFHSLGELSDWLRRPPHATPPQTAHKARNTRR